MATKILHGKVEGYDGNHEEREGKSYPTHLNGQGVSIFGAAHNSVNPKKYPSHENAYGSEIHGPARSNTVKTNYPHVKVMFKRETLHTPSTSGGKGIKGNFGRLVGRSQ